MANLVPAKHTSLEQFTEDVLRNFANELNIIQALFYVKSLNADSFQCSAQYAYFSEDKPAEFKIGETLSGQAVKNKTVVALNSVPDDYMTIVSGLGKGKPKSLVFVPITNADESIGLIEYATFESFTDRHQKALEKVSKKVADTIVKLQKK